VSPAWRPYGLTGWMIEASALSDEFLDEHISEARARIAQGHPPQTTLEIADDFMAQLDNSRLGTSDLDESEQAQIRAAMLALWLATVVQRLILQEAAT
jgi:hypothetical protein